MNDNEATLGNPIDLNERKIGIGFCSPDLIPVDFYNSIQQLIQQSGQFVKLGLTNATSSRITVNRNKIVENARMMKCTDILWIDVDSVFPVQALMQLVIHQKDIVCATTCSRKGLDRSAIGVALDYASIKPADILVKMRQIGFPFMLTSMKVFDKIDELGLAPDGTYFAEPPRWMMRKLGWEIEGTDGLVAEDEYWCYLVIKAGFDIWCDMQLSMQIGHIGLQTHYIQNPEESDLTRAGSREAIVDEQI